MKVLDRHKGPSVYQSQHGTVLSYPKRVLCTRIDSGGCVRNTGTGTPRHEPDTLSQRKGESLAHLTIHEPFSADLTRTGLSDSRRDVIKRYIYAVSFTSSEHFCPELALHFGRIGRKSSGQQKF